MVVDIFSLGRVQYLLLWIRYRKTGGVAIVVDPIVNKALLQHKPVNDRIISICLHSKPYPVTVIQVYAPTTMKEDDVVEAFY